MLTVKDLPDDVLELVFRKLTLAERKTIRLVNKHWLAVCNLASLTQHEVLSVDFKDLHLLKNPRGVLNLEICYKDELQSPIKDSPNQQERQVFWTTHGNSVKSLRLLNLHLQYPILTNITNYCPKLTELLLYYACHVYGDSGTIGDSARGPISEIKCPVTLTLISESRESFVGGAEFIALTKNVPKLKRLVLSFINLNDKSCFEPLISLIKKQAFTLEELVLNFCPMETDEFLESFSDILGPQLSGLYIQHATIQTIDWLCKLEAKSHNLEKLELSSVSFPKDISLTNIFKFKNLKYFSVNISSERSISLVPSNGLERLKGLEFGIISLDDDATIKCFGQRTYPNLIAFKMDSRAITDYLIASLMPKFPNLKFLDLSFGGYTTAWGMSAIFSNCKNLTHLLLEWCSGIQNLLKFNVRLVNSLKKLVYLNLSACYGLNSTNVSKLRLNKLRTLHLVGISLTETALKKLMKNCPNLKRVYLEHEDRVANYGVVKNSDIFTFEQCNDEITVFNFSEQ